MFECREASEALVESLGTEVAQRALREALAHRYVLEHELGRGGMWAPRDS